MFTTLSEKKKNDSCSDGEIKPTILFLVMESWIEAFYKTSLQVLASACRQIFQFPCTVEMAFHRTNQRLKPTTSKLTV